MNTKLINILYADDDTDDCIFFKEALKALPVQTNVTTVKDGEELMNYLFAHTDCMPHVLFLDINMPRKNGIECLSEIKQHAKLKDLPVIMFSTSNSKEDISTLFTKGAHVYVHKPSDFVQLIQVINNAIPLAIENVFSNGKLNYILNA